MLYQAIAGWNGNHPIQISTSQLGLQGPHSQKWDMYVKSLKGVGLCRNMKGDYPTWNCPLKKPQLVVAKNYHQIMSEARESTLVDWSPMLWRLKAPLKIILSCWLAWKNCILTWDNLCRRCLQRPGRCSLYGEELETISHLFFLSRIASGIWETIFAYFKFGSKLLTSLEQSLRWGLGMRGIYCYIPLFVIWEILKARNHQIFIGKQLKAYSISSKIIVWTEGIHPREKHHKDMMGRHLSMMIMPPIEFF